MITGIYKIENQKTHQVYIGQAYNVPRRLRTHKTTYSSAQLIDKDIKKYGVDNFSYELIEECSIEQLDEKEKYWIGYYNSFENGYNQTRGGSGASDCGNKLTLESVQQIYELLLNSSMTQHEIAILFGVGDDTISEINHGLTRIQPGYTFPLRKKIKSQKTVHVSFFLTEEQLIQDFIELKSFAAIGRKYNVSSHPVRDIANKYGYTAESLKIKYLQQKPKGRPIVQMDKDGNILQEFESTYAAGRQIHDEHIKQVCDGKRKSSKGYIYRYKDEL